MTTMILAAYVGPSMNPTLREPEMMEIVPYGTRSVRAGDIVCFRPPSHDYQVVHRVARLTPAGMTTRGDRNLNEDSYLVRREDITGQVVAAWRGQSRREIAGGLEGRMTSRWLRWRRLPGNIMSRLLHPWYDALSRSGLVARLLPARFRPRVVVFRTPGQDQLRLLVRHHVIGRYDAQTRQWQIRRPFRVCVDERQLLRP